MTRQQAKDLLPIIAAYAEGKSVQFRNSSTDGWQDAPEPKFARDVSEYRIKPEPVTRPWSKPEDVPGPVCWVQRIGGKGWPCMVVEIDTRGVCVGRGPTHGLWVPWQQIAEWEYSTDRKTWHPCTVTDNQ